MQVDRPEIEHCVRWHGGKRYVLAVNTAATSLDASIPGDAAQSACRSGNVLFEERQVEIVDGVLRDTFTPYEPHVYEIAEQAPDGACGRHADGPCRASMNTRCTTH